MAFLGACVAIDLNNGGPSLMGLMLLQLKPEKNFSALHTIYYYFH